jgi:mannan endo-1,4-beta-mannosidase
MSRYPGDEFVDILGTDIYEFVAPNEALEDAGDRFYEQVEEMLTTLAAISFEHNKLICLSETGLESIPDTTWWTEYLYPSIEGYPISYVLTWRNAHDQPKHFYAAWPGFEGADDFKAFSELDNIVFLP